MVGAHIYPYVENPRPNFVTPAVSKMCLLPASYGLTWSHRSIEADQILGSGHLSGSRLKHNLRPAGMTHLTIPSPKWLTNFGHDQIHPKVCHRPCLGSLAIWNRPTFHLWFHKGHSNPTSQTANHVQVQDQGVTPTNFTTVNLHFPGQLFACQGIHCSIAKQGFPKLKS